MAAFGSRNRLGIVLVGCVALGLGSGCDQISERFSGGSDTAAAHAGPHADLLIGYELLQETLGTEGGLGLLRVFKKITFHPAADDIQDFMKKIGHASRERGKELEKLRKLPPDVSAKPPPGIGDAIQSAVTEAGKHDTLHPDGSFSVRFVFLQAQATRMVNVIASQTAAIESNAERRKWLTTVAAEYEGYHDELIEIVERHGRFKGDE